MTKSQKMIKYIAMALAIALTTTIIGTIGFLCMGILGFTNSANHNLMVTEYAENAVDCNYEYSWDYENNWCYEGDWDYENNEYYEDDWNYEDDEYYEDDHSYVYNPVDSNISSFQNNPSTYSIPSTAQLYYSNNDYYDINILEISNAYGQLTIHSSDDIDSILVYGNNVSEDFLCETDGNTLILNNNNNLSSLFSINDQKSPSIILLLPSDMYIEKSVLENGAGSLNVSYLHPEELSLSTGAGKTVFSYVTAGEADISCGVGTSEFENCNFFDVTLSCGVGTTSYSGYLNGDCEISGGVGKVSLDIWDVFESYDISITNGLGSISVNDEVYTGGSNKKTRLNRDASNSLTLKGGVGNISVNFIDSY